MKNKSNTAPDKSTEEIISEGEALLQGGKRFKADFKYDLDQIGIAPSGLTAPIVKCAVSAIGNEYLLRNQYAQQWVAECDLKIKE